MKSNKILSFDDLGNCTYGGKADGLIFLQKQGFRVPAFFVLDYLTISGIISEKGNFETLVSDWISENKIDADSLWAVRSSAGVEDGQNKSFAGLFSTILNCTLSEISSAILKVIDDFKTVFNTEYYQGNNAEFNILIQLMVPSEVAGVAFSQNPLNRNDLSAYLTVLPGLGPKLVSGEETAMSIRLTKKEQKIMSSEEAYVGEVFNNGYKEVLLSKQTLFDRVEQHLPKIYSSLKKLENLKGFPVDTEICIYNSQIYWLQVRPITTIEELKESNIWDNSNVSSNYPGIVMPITSSFVNHAYGNAYISMCRFLGGNKKFIQKNLPLFRSMSGTIKGAMYYNITAWQKLAYQLPFGKSISSLLTSMWGADDAHLLKTKQKSKPLSYLRFSLNIFNAFIFYRIHKKIYLRKFENEVSSFDPLTIQKFDHNELNAKLKTLEKNLGDKWFVPMINGMFTMLFFNYLKRVIAKSRLHDSHPNFANDVLFGSGDVISVTIVRKLQQLLSVISENTEVKDIFDKYEPAIIKDWVKVQCPEINILIEEYISNYGERSEEGELKIETINYKEDPLKFYAFLKSSLSTPHIVRPKLESFDFKKLIKQKYRYNPAKVFLLNRLVSITINRVRDRENFRFIRTKTFGMVRQIFRAIDKELRRAGKIEADGDSMYLYYSEIMDVAQDKQYKQIIADRKKEYEGYRTVEHSIRYSETDNVFTPVEKGGDFSTDMKGAGCCSGRIEGEVLIIDKNSIQNLDLSGKILVATYFEPGWIGLFARSGGLISERGSLLSHTAILCRELGIPSIIGAKGIMSKLQNGDIIRMDGATGIIEKITVNEEI